MPCTYKIDHHIFEFNRWRPFSSTDRYRTCAEAKKALLAEFAYLKPSTVKTTFARDAHYNKIKR